jgi:hypothetical protein
MVNEMSTELVVPVQKKGKELIFQDQVKAWLETVSAGKELFVSVVPSNVRRKYPNSFSVGFIAWIGVTGMDLVGEVVMRLHSGWTPLDETQQAVFSGMVFGPAFAAAIVSSWIAHKGDKRTAAIWDSVVEFEKQGLSAWLKARYGLIVSDETLKEMAEKILSNQATQFSDDEGSIWVLRDTPPDAAGNVSWFVEEQQLTVVEEPAMLEASVVEVVLPGEAKTLHDSILNRLDVLKAYSLSVESSHNVSRSEQEARQAILSYRKLEALGEGAHGYAELVDVLSAVNEDLLAIVTRS